MNKKKHLSRIKLSFIMLLFAVCLIINVLFCSTYNLYELLDKTTAIETRAISESIAANEDGDNNTYFKTSFLKNNNSYNETITKKICTISVSAAIQKRISLFLFLVIVFLFFFLCLFILLPDDWTLISQKVRMDN